MKKDAASRPPPSRPRATGALARQPSASDESQRRGDATRGAPRRRSRRSARGALGAPLEVEPPAARRGALATCLRWPLPGDGSGTCHGVMGLKSKHSTCPLLTPCRGGAPGSTGSVVGAPRSPDSSRRAPRAPFVPEQPNPQPLQPLADYGRAVAPGHRRPRPEFDPTLFATTEPPGGAVWIVDARTLEAASRARAQSTHGARDKRARTARARSSAPSVLPCSFLVADERAPVGTFCADGACPARRRSATAAIMYA